MTKLGFQLGGDAGVWIHSDFEDSEYTDGVKNEAYILKALSEATDLQTLSSGLPQLIRDWPSQYHLSPERGNVLSVLPGDLSGIRVLEVGAGFGAVTRELGERSGNVVALEGSLRRATGARMRTRDLENVEVVATSFNQFFQKPDLIWLSSLVSWNIQKSTCPGLLPHWIFCDNVGLFYETVVNYLLELKINSD